MKSLWGAVFLILELCLLSALTVEILPQTELRELDIFTQDEEYQQITRAKRTDEDIQDEGENSGEGPLPIPEIIFSTGENEDQDESEQGNSTNETPPETPVSNFKFKIEPRLDAVDSGLETKTDLPTEGEVGVNPENSEIQHIAVSSLDPVPTPEESISTDPSKQENSSTADVNSTGTIDTAELSPPVIESRSGLSQDNTSETETTQDGTEGNLPEIGRAVVSFNSSETLDGVQGSTLNSNLSTSGNASETGSSNATLNDTQNATDPPPQNILPDNNGNTTVNSTIPTNSTTTSNATDNNVSSSNSTIILNNTTATDISGTSTINSTNTNASDISPTKPVVAESDKTQQGSVSGSGILLTIIILVAIAGLAALGYVIYKRRSGGYTPVNVNDDQGKELNEIENGFGKPIRDDEVRIEDQLTPIQPMAAPRTFMTPPTEKKLSDADVRANNDRNTREESIEVEDEEEKKKADE